MLSTSSLLVALTAAVGVYAAPARHHEGDGSCGASYTYVDAESTAVSSTVASSAVASSAVALTSASAASSVLSSTVAVSAAAYTSSVSSSSVSSTLASSTLSTVVAAVSTSVASSSTLAATSAVSTASTATVEASAAGTTVATGEGTNNGFFYSYYNLEGDIVYTMYDAGRYTTSWTDDEDFVAGKGWAVGSGRNITYSGTFTPTGNAFLNVYGWTTDELCEYYITESYGEYNPGYDYTHMGTVTSDGGVYDIYKNVRTNEPSIQGTATFNQYWSIRQLADHRTSGTVTTQNHFDAWSALGMDIGTTFNYQILSTEGISGSAGSSDITVSAD